MRISSTARIFFRKPMGRIVKPPELARLAKARRLVSVGDRCTVDLLKTGIRPYIAVFDFKTERRKISREDRKLLKAVYPGPITLRNQSGTINRKLFPVVKKMLKTGGPLRIIGEEDLTAVPFVLEADPEKHRIIYGQPKKGAILVLPVEGLKSKIREMLVR